MNLFLKYLGVILVLLAVVCAIIYKCAAPVNGLLVTSCVLALAGIITYIICHKYID